MMTEQSKSIHNKSLFNIFTISECYKIVPMGSRTITKNEYIVRVKYMKEVGTCTTAKKIKNT
jgi:hypothetical protein